jgi:ABC-type multidrug transport system permease subunit
MQIVTQFDPVAYAVDLMRGALFGEFFFPVWQSLLALAAFNVLFAFIAIRIFSRGEDTHVGAANLRWGGR